ncbi:MAG: hypothetical protein A2X86_11915 [Bdellovibrionales bacterium GWA2_49_15]|nr:MAG: hypothetical protein A2X86_11915 [Bdellovibrionales bacterium GWA2_49_15]HAZ12542.1 hypothetical protein [Bdellovibrionales bacterium]
MNKILRKILLSLFFVGMLPVHALEVDYEEYYTIYGKTVKIGHLEKKRISVSSDCYEKRPEFNCQATQVLGKASMKGIDKQYFSGGADKGAVICKRQLNGTLMLGKDNKGNESTFCQFQDNSFVQTGSLWYHADRNDHGPLE